MSIGFFFVKLLNTPFYNAYAYDIIRLIIKVVGQLSRYDKEDCL